MVSYRKIRLKFSKLGALKFISHLDLDRTMKSAITRAGIDIEYTHGYNPRPYLVFSLPAALGIESVSEFLDIKADDTVSAERIKTALNGALPPDIRIIDAYIPQSDFKQIARSRYRITLTDPVINENTADEIKRMFEGEVIVEKRTKKTETGTAPFDIAPYVKINGAEYDKGALTLDVTAAASNSVYINPEYIVKAIGTHIGTPFSDPRVSLYTVLRLAVFFEDGSQFS